MVSISPLVGDLNPNHFVAIHEERLKRLESTRKFIIWFASWGLEGPLTLDERGDLGGDIRKLLLGFPCGGCGSAESLCCCDQEPDDQEGPDPDGS
jgi:hypothetical protein